MPTEAERAEILRMVGLTSQLEKRYDRFKLHIWADEGTYVRPYETDVLECSFRKDGQMYELSLKLDTDPAHRLMTFVAMRKALERLLLTGSMGGG